MAHPNEMTVEDFLALPRPDASFNTEDVGSIVILPMGPDELHESGYRAMAFVLCSRAGEAVCRIGGNSDAVHLEGVGGMGHEWLQRYGTCPKLIPPTAWSIDCLAKSGLIRMFVSSDFCDRIIVDDFMLSSFEVWGHLRPDRDPRPAPNGRES